MMNKTHVLMNKVKQLEQRVHVLEDQQNGIQWIHVSNKEAEKRIRLYIKKRKEQGMNTISMLDFVKDLKLPAEQIDHVMKQLEQEKVVYEAE